MCTISRTPAGRVGRFLIGQGWGRAWQEQTTELERNMMKALLPILCLAAALPVENSWGVGTFLGTYSLNYRDNAAGLFTDQSNP